MKKLLTIILVLTLSIGLCACGGKNDKKEEAKSTTQEPTTMQIDKEQTVFNDKDFTVVYKGTDKEQICVEFTNNSKKSVDANCSIKLNNAYELFSDTFRKSKIVKNNASYVFKFQIKDFEKIGIKNKTDIKNIKVFASAFKGKNDFSDSLLKMKDYYLIDCGDPSYKAEIKDDSKLAIDKKGVKAYLTDIKKPKTSGADDESKAEYIFRVDNSTDKVVQIRIMNGEINGKEAMINMPLQYGVEKNEIMLDDIMSEASVEASKVKTAKFKYFIYEYDNYSDVSITDDVKGKLLAKGTTDLIKWK